MEDEEKSENSFNYRPLPFVFGCLTGIAIFILFQYGMKSYQMTKYTHMSNQDVTERLVYPQLLHQPRYECFCLSIATKNSVTDENIFQMCSQRLRPQKRFLSCYFLILNNGYKRF